MVQIILHPKFKGKLKITLWSKLFYILPSYKIIDGIKIKRYAYMWLSIGIIIEKNK